MTSFLSVSAAGSRSASTQYRAKIVAFFSDPLFVAVIMTRFAFWFCISAIDPPLELVQPVLRRLFPWVPVEASAWPALLWATGRGELPGYGPGAADWMAHCAPLAEWDGHTIPHRPRA